VASDDNESDDEAALPPSVERALAEARAKAANAGPNQKPPPPPSNARWLALIPVAAGLLAMFLVMPRAVAPEDIPLPQIDMRSLDAARRDDAARADRARTTRLSSDVLMVGTALRALNQAQVRNASVEELGAARVTLEHAFRLAGEDRAQAVEGLRSLRAVQLEAFLTEVEKFEQTGKSTEELEALGGTFVDRMAAGGWIRDGKVLLDEAARRSAYKLVWNAQVGADRFPELALSVDEQRALYIFYLTHPHAPEAQRAAYENMRRSAADSAECRRAVALETEDTEQWRIEKIRRLGEVDASYPTAYALGVAYYRAGRFDRSVESFRSWLASHPDGPLALRARNHMKAALAAFGSS
jgi:tetratricopeptide (TPR) repeat protein